MLNGFGAKPVFHHFDGSNSVVSEVRRYRARTDQLIINIDSRAWGRCANCHPSADTAT